MEEHEIFNEHKFYFEGEEESFMGTNTNCDESTELNEE
jgi:hypothetical protein